MNRGERFPKRIFAARSIGYEYDARFESIVNTPDAGKFSRIRVRQATSCNVAA